MEIQKKCSVQEVAINQAEDKTKNAIFWYKHDLGDTGEFCRNMESENVAKTQIGMTYQLIRYLQDNNYIENYADNNAGGYKVVSDGNVINNLVRDESIDTPIVENEPKEGDLRVWYIHQFGSDGMFFAPVSTPDTAMEFLYTNYDLMLYLFDQGKIKDYCNAGGLEVYERNSEGDLEWCEWYSEDGFDVGEIMAMYIDDGE